jgi:translation initiation factor 1
MGGVMDNSRLVYSTEEGRICPQCRRPAKKCRCQHGKKALSPKETHDGILRIRREVKGRKGKAVTTISGFDLDGGELKALATRLKRQCGSGGGIKEGIVIIQGDHRQALAAELARQGYKVKLAGG